GSGGEGLVGAVGNAAGVGGHEPVVVGATWAEGTDSRDSGAGARARASADAGGGGAVGRGGAEIEAIFRRGAVWGDRAGKRGRLCGHRARRTGARGWSDDELVGADVGGADRAGVAVEVECPIERAVDASVDRGRSGRLMVVTGGSVDERRLVAYVAAEAGEHGVAPSDLNMRSDDV